MRGRRGRTHVGHTERGGQRSLLLVALLDLFRQIIMPLAVGLQQGGERVIVTDVQLFDKRLELILRWLVAFHLVGFEQLLNFRRECGAPLVGELALRRGEQVVDLLLQFGDFRLDGEVVVVDFILHRDGVDRHVIAELYGREKGAHAEVVGLRDRVVFMIMTIGAGKRQTEERLAGGVDEIGHQLIMPFAVLLENGTRGVVGTEAQVTGGDELIDLGLVPRRIRSGGQLVAGELFADERVERLVVVESAHHVIAIVKLCRTELIPFESVGIGVAHDIEPVSGPTHAVLWAGEQAVDEPFVRAGR